MVKHINSSILALSFCVLYSCSGSIELVNTTDTNDLSENPKNIVLMIGDGMGLTQVSAAMYEQKRPLYLERMPIVGLQKTHAKDGLITDSAASATAIARGIKANIGTFGTDLKYRAPSSILERWEDRGFNTGIIVTSSVTHATPAAFYTYAESRNQHESIALDLMKSGVDLLIGGGLEYFNRRSLDDRDLLDELKRSGYYTELFLEKEFDEIPISAPKYAYFMSRTDPLPIENGRKPLGEYCAQGLQFLNAQRDPFFLLIEGSQIDWGGHANNSTYVIGETRDFDRAVGTVLNFAKRNKETLVIVTADHETGGLSINEKIDNRILYKFTTKTHTATMVPVYAYGPGASKFSGIYDNTELFQKLKSFLKADEQKLSTN